MRKAWGRKGMMGDSLTLLMTASWASISRILNQMPMFSALSATARLREEGKVRWDKPGLTDKLLGIEANLHPVVE